jgi:hypothetical protein
VSTESVTFDGSTLPPIDGAKVERAFMRATCLQLHEEAQAAARSGELELAIRYFDRAVDLHFLIKPQHQLPCFLRPQAYA